MKVPYIGRAAIDVLSLHSYLGNPTIRLTLRGVTMWLVIIACVRLQPYTEDMGCIK